MTFTTWLPTFLYSQFLVTPPIPTTSFTGQTVIVTGSNTGLGLSAATQIASLNAAKIILAVRTPSKGAIAKTSIETLTGRKGIVEVWPLDLSRYDSVKAFVARAERELERVDVVLANAGMMTRTFRMVEGDEETVTINVVSTFLLALLLVPKMRATGARFDTQPRLSVVSSDLHFVAKFPERKAAPGGIFEALSDERKADMGDRYAVTKLVEVLLVRELSARLGDEGVIVNCLTPGACHSDFFREDVGVVMEVFMKIMMRIVARTTEVGGRTLVLAAGAGEESKGRYMADGVVARESAFVRSEEGKEVGERVWRELMVKLEGISPGIEGNVM